VCLDCVRRSSAAPGVAISRMTCITVRHASVRLPWRDMDSAVGPAVAAWGAAPGFVVSLGHLPLAMRFQQREQALAHDEYRPIRGHVHLDHDGDVNDRVAD